jgi:hypothetical protein
MTTAQEILNQQDVFLAIKQKKSEKQAELQQIQQTLSKALTNAISPLPRATNKMDFAMQIAKNAFNIWQGISLGIKIVRGFRSAFKK